jgi:transcription initiation factor IIE alpha subunit
MEASREGLRSDELAERSGLKILQTRDALKALREKGIIARYGRKPNIRWAVRPEIWILVNTRIKRDPIPRRFRLVRKELVRQLRERVDAPRFI